MGVGTYTNSTIAGYDLAVVGTAIDYLYISAKYTDNNCYIRTWSKYASVANINSSGLYILSILSPSNVICNRNGINLINDFQNHNILYPPNYNIYVGVLNNAGTLGNFTNRTYYCDFEGDKLTSDECRMVYNIVKKFCARKGQSLSIIQNNKAIPEKYFLSQNFPNPFNPITNIKFQIKESNFVTLKVYNALGEEIATLVNKNLNPGT